MELKEKIQITTLINHFKSVGFSFAKSMKQMVESDDIKPPKGYTKQEYLSLIDIAYEQGLMKSIENTNNKNKRIKEVNNLD
jgi:hypothetical protein